MQLLRAATDTSGAAEGAVYAVRDRFGIG